MEAAVQKEQKSTHAAGNLRRQLNEFSSTSEQEDYKSAEGNRYNRTKINENTPNFC